MNYGLVSVIMPAYNSSKTIEKSIQSVLKQKYTKLELIIVNDGSNDETINVIKKHMVKDERIVLIDRQHNKGISESRNQAISIAKGKWIAFLDSDDIWYENKLSTQLKKMNEHEALFSCTSYNVSKENDIFELRKQEKFYDYFELLQSNVIGCLTVIVSSNIAKQNLFVNVKHEDYATWLNIMRNEDIKVYFIDSILSEYNKTENSVSSNKFKSLIWALRIINRQPKLSYFCKKKYQVIYTVNLVKKYMVA